MQQLNKHSALLLIEFQYEWLNENGKLYSLMNDKPQFHQSIKSAARALDAARQTTIPIIHSGLSFSADYQELGMAKSGLRAEIPKHKTFSEMDAGSQFVAPFEPQKKEFQVQGRIGSSAFAGSNLDCYLKNNNINTLYLMGYALHVCVESTIRTAHDMGYEVILIEDATTAFTAQQKNHFLTEIMHHFGTSITANEFIKSLREETTHAK